MNSYFWDSKANNKFGSNSNCYGQFSENLGGYRGEWKGGSDLISGSLVLDGERDELVKAPAKDGKRIAVVPEEKAMAALRSHSEAERRRRERINAHLDTLRGLLPCTEKMDKAALLAEVVSQVKQLKKTATQAMGGLLVPIDADEVKVESLRARDGTVSFRASICCDYGSEILSELTRALNTLHLNMVNSEISTLGSRMKYVFLFTSRNDTDKDNAETRQLLVDSVHQTLTSILEKVAALAEYFPATMFPNKRRRISLFESSSSSS